MYFFAIIKSQSFLSGNKILTIPCGSTYCVNVDNRLSYFNQINTAFAHFENVLSSSDRQNLVGIAATKCLRNVNYTLSIALSDHGSHSVSSFKQFDLSNELNVKFLVENANEFLTYNKITNWV